MHWKGKKKQEDNKWGCLKLIIYKNRDKILLEDNLSLWLKIYFKAGDNLLLPQSARKREKSWRCSLVCWACYLLHCPPALRVRALEMQKNFFKDKTLSSHKGDGNLYFDYFHCTDIVLLCKHNCKTLLRYCIENTHRKNHIYTHP